MSEPRAVADIEMQVLHNDTASATPAPLRTLQLRVAVVERDGSGRRYLVALQEDKSGGLIMKGLKEMAGAARYKVWLQRLLGRKPAIFQGMVTLVSRLIVEPAAAAG